MVIKVKLFSMYNEIIAHCILKLFFLIAVLHNACALLILLTIKMNELADSLEKRHSICGYILAQQLLCGGVKLVKHKPIHG